MEKRIWIVGQTVAVFGLILVVAGLLTYSELTLRVFWYAMVPVLPLTFLISPAIWRNICPLATLNMLPRPSAAGSPPTSTATARAVGVVLLIALIPTRHLWFNEHPQILAGAIIVIALIALGLGIRYPVKAGFCNAVCPVLPVERLYGHRPFVTVANQRCVPCTTCTASTCIDLAPTKSVAQTIGPRRRTVYWTRTVFGGFAAAFPGVVAGYFVAPLLGEIGWVSAFGYVVLGGATSWIVTTGLVHGFHPDPERTVTLLAGIAVSLYYAFAIPAIGNVFGFPLVTMVAAYLVAGSLIGFWWRRASNVNAIPAGAATT